MPRKWKWLVLLTAWLALDGWVARRWWMFRREHRAEPLIVEASERYGMDPALIKAVIWRESDFKAGARGAAGELGLMQVSELAGQEWADAEGVTDYDHSYLLDGRRNTVAGTWYLRKLLRRYQTTDNPVAYALADYNAGRSRVLRWNKGAAATNSTAFLAAIDFPGTRAYVLAVLKQRDHYRRELEVAPEAFSQR
jgi:peptidoglycan lytic transglycosylase